MNRPYESSAERGPARVSPTKAQAGQKSFAEQQQRDRRKRVPKNAREVVETRAKRRRGIIDGVGESLDRPIEIRWRRVDEHEVVETFRNQSPAPNQRVPEHKRRIIPDKVIAQRRRIADENNRDKNQNCPSCFHDKRGDQYSVRVHLRIFMSIFRLPRGPSLAGLLLGALLMTTSTASAEGVPGDCSQLIVAIAPEWNSMRGELQLFERSHGNDWNPLAPAI